MANHRDTNVLVNHYFVFHCSYMVHLESRPPQANCRKYAEVILLCPFTFGFTFQGKISSKFSPLHNIKYILQLRQLLLFFKRFVAEMQYAFKRASTILGVLGNCLTLNPSQLVTYIYIYFFDVLLTIHLSIFVSVINQLDAQNFCFTISLFHASTCFEHTS